MTDHFHFVRRSGRIRCRKEDDDNFLLYNPESDQLHMIDARGKLIFDLCDGRPIDDVVIEGVGLLAPSGEEDARGPGDVLAFLCELRKRALVEFT